jgi:hypothetical protein
MGTEQEIVNQTSFHVPFGSGLQISLCAWLLFKFYYYFGQASWTSNFHMRMVNLPHEELEDQNLHF